MTYYFSKLEEDQHSFFFLKIIQDKKKNPAYGSDVLRLWVANCEYTRDVTIGPSIICKISHKSCKMIYCIYISL